MTLARVVLIVTGLSFLGYGLFCWFVPDTVGNFSGLVLAAGSARNEVIAMYGGLQAGAGLFFLVAGARRALVAPGLLALVLIMGGLALARGSGLLMLGSTGYNAAALLYESLTAVLGIVALLRLPRPLPA